MRRAQRQISAGGEEAQMVQEEDARPALPRQLLVALELAQQSRLDGNVVQPSRFVTRLVRVRDEHQGPFEALGQLIGELQGVLDPLGARDEGDESTSRSELIRELVAQLAFVEIGERELRPGGAQVNDLWTGRVRVAVVQHANGEGRIVVARRLHQQLRVLPREPARREERAGNAELEEREHDDTDAGGPRRGGEAFEELDHRHECYLQSGRAPHEDAPPGSAPSLAALALLATRWARR